MHSRLSKALCILLTLIVAFSGACLSTNSFAKLYTDPFTLTVSTDKPSYGLSETVTVTATLTNSDSFPYASVTMDAVSPDYTCTSGETSATIAVLEPGAVQGITFKAALTRSASGLRFFQRLILFFKYWFRSLPAIVGIGTGSHCQTQTLTVQQGGVQRTMEIRVFYTARTVTTLPTSTVTHSQGETAGFQITMLDVGQGLSLLLRCGDSTMLYDGGGRSTSSYVVAYLREHEVDTLDYMFVSHYDEDHLAGLVGVLNTTPVRTVVSPDYAADTAIYTSYQTKLAQNGAAVVHPYVGQTFSLGEADVQVLGPKDYTYDSENSYSVAVRVTYGSFSCVITGDAEAEAEQDMLSSGLPLNAELYVVGHHGSSFSNSAAFVRAVAPKYAFISCGKDNSYGHPTAKTMAVLAENGTRYFRTDEQGEVTCYATRSSYWFSAVPKQETTTTTTTTATTTTTTSTTMTTTTIVTERTVYYTRTGSKYHYLNNCGSGTYYPCTLEEALNKGLTPCSKCVH